MHAEVISVGTELTTGAMLDTNSQWLSLELAEIGIPVHFHTTVADNLEAMVGVLRIAADRSDVIVLSGGLGPTLDDLTRQALAAVLGVELVLDAPSLDWIRSIFARFKREMPERNVVQAYFPAGTQPLPNPRGTAPGIWAEIQRSQPRGKCLVAALPGVPHEMKRMFHKEVVPRLPGGNCVIKRARMNCFGVGESQAEEMLGDLTVRGRDPEVGITVHEATIVLRIVAHGQTPDECRAKIETTKAAIRERLGDLIFGEEDEQLEHAVIGLLNDRGQSFALVEIGTGGLLARRIRDSAGNDRCFRGAVIAPTLAGAAKALGAAENSNPTTSAETSRERISIVAQHCRERFAADFALAIGEFPPYEPEDHTREAPKAELALLGPGASRIVDYTFLGDRNLNASRATKVALNLLRLHFVRSRATTAT
jgi:nicotinamide-nucleotide amidase